MSDPRRGEDGFSLIELLVALTVVLLLILIAIPVYVGFQRSSHDTVPKNVLVAAAKVEGAIYQLDGEFSNDVGRLSLDEPALDWSGLNPGSVHVVVDEVDPGSGLNEQVLLYAKSKSGTWFGIRLVSHGGLAGRHTCKGPAVTDVNDIAACLGENW